ncbi:type 2 periplasmic-binding domain-containing protein [Paenibacillus arenilitoris]|uniref:ABC transporter substrate-binding protein n=1 Tax=Paenibacillus arenilitoris TaxID=2772299 RepID=A0A927H8A6_9BACL|nr:hypothetical protein [Paenibacillus arenilitoris]MBD2871367.1 hypothetical protein [Paenibacillus arenilitoris]
MKAKKFINSMVIISMVGMLMAACTNSPNPNSNSNQPSGENSETVTLTFGALGGSNLMDEKWWPDDMTVEIEKKLNIKLEWEIYDMDKLNLALAGNDLPDMMAIPVSYVQQVLDSKLAVPLDDYLDEYGTNIDSYTTRNDIVRKFLSNEDGKLYFRTPNTSLEGGDIGSEGWAGYVVRWDLFKQLGAPKIANDDDYIHVLKQMRDLQPETETGQKVYGMGIPGADGLWQWNIGKFATMGYVNNTTWGYASSVKDNSLIQNYLDVDKSPFWAAMKLFNRLNREGLFDPDSFTMKSEEMNEKAARGQYVGAKITWDVGKYNEAMKQADPNTIKGFMAIPAEGQYSWYGERPIAGWGDKEMFITSTSKNIEKAVQLFDFLDSPEGNRLHYSGVEGKHWEYKDGVPTIMQSTIDLRNSGNSDEWSKTGIGSMHNIIGAGGKSKHPDGYAYDLFQTKEALLATLSPLQKDFAKHYNVEYPGQLQMNMVAEGKHFDQSSSLAATINIGIGGAPSDISRIDAKMDEIATKAIPTLVMAKNDEEFNAARDKFIKDINAAGADKAWQWWQQQWNASREYVMSVDKK